MIISLCTYIYFTREDDLIMCVHLLQFLKSCRGYFLWNETHLETIRFVLLTRFDTKKWLNF